MMAKAKASKTTPAQRLEIRRLSREGYSLSQLAKAFGVVRSRVHQIIHADEETVKAWEANASLVPLDPVASRDDN